ncbi:LysE family translocator [Lacibacter sediminis]|uniref:LysE family transporter n=1 Tax=Lacibacter sediminis TaxID=2760713 RepID=A0A7G5XDN5_9BACT|nr:LysE family transporter [Lacibacter sediminis]QNA43588.1 LysE family transporter [Lacibacter sediminis]
MPQFAKILMWGFIISFLGSLPLGTLNIAAMQIGITDGISPALWFSAGSLTAEIIYVRLSLVAMDWVRKQEKLLKALEWVTFIIVLALAISSFWAAAHPSVGENVILSSGMHRGLLGFTMSLINPVQIPFWFGWSTVLFTKKILKPEAGNYNFYIIGIGIGTFAGNCIFIFGGRLLVDRLNASQHLLNWIIGGVFLFTALFQLYRIFRKKDAIHQLEHPEEVTGGLEKNIH